MIYYKLLFLFYLILNTFSANHVSALNTEELVGGYSVRQMTFKYQAGITGKYNSKSTVYLLCGAGIISDDFLMSFAQCFIYKPGNLRSFAFFAVINSDITLSGNFILRDISRIYTHFYNRHVNTDGIAIVRLNNSLNLGNRHDLIPLEIPDYHESFHGRTAVVAGFGIDTIDKLMNNQPKRELVRITSRYSLRLKYANVTIMTDGEFKDTSGDTGNIDEICGDIVKHDNEICGIIPTDNTFSEERGVCIGDLGAPLVIDNKVVGVLIKRNDNCDDTQRGAVYKKVSIFRQFIDAIKAGRSQENIKIYENNKHVPQYSREDISTV